MGGNKDFSGDSVAIRLNDVETQGDAETMEAFEELRLELDPRSIEMQPLAGMTWKD